MVSYCMRDFRYICHVCRLQLSFRRIEVTTTQVVCMQDLAVYWPSSDMTVALHAITIEARYAVSGASPEPEFPAVS